MRRLFNMLLGIIVAVLFALASAAIIYGTLTDAKYKHEGFRVDLFELTIGGVVAFLVATLGIAVANEAKGARASIRAAVSGTADKGGGEWLIAGVGGLYLLVGLMFVVIAVFPGLIAVEPNITPKPDAPAYITTQAKAFVGVALAGLASVATALKASS